MKGSVEDNTLIIIKKPKTIYFYFPEKLDNSLKHEIDFIIKTMTF